MKLQIDTSVPYALALEGGGAKGSYQIGAWQALREAGVTITAVSGTSVGALNGAMIVMDDLTAARNVWENIRYSQVMDVDDDMVRKLVKGDLREMDLRAAAGAFKNLLDNRGLDVTPLYEWMRSVVDEETVRNAPTELYIVTYSVKEQKELELRAKDLPEGTLHDMLLASAYLPVFHSDRIGGRFADGGVRDVLPLHVLLANGYRNILALRLFGVGIERRIRIPKDANILTVAPKDPLGSTLEFTPERGKMNITVGYFDTQRVLYGLRGNKMYIDPLWEEDHAYGLLMDAVYAALKRAGRTASLRSVHEDILPRLAGQLSVKGNYCELAEALLEAAAMAQGLERWRIYTEEELLALVEPSYISARLDAAVAEKSRFSLPIKL